MVASPLRPERGPATVALHKLQQDTLGEIAAVNVFLCFERSVAPPALGGQPSLLLMKDAIQDYPSGDNQPYRSNARSSALHALHKGFFPTIELSRNGID